MVRAVSTANAWLLSIKSLSESERRKALAADVPVVTIMSAYEWVIGHWSFILPFADLHLKALGLSIVSCAVLYCYTTRWKTHLHNYDCIVFSSDPIVVVVKHARTATD